MASLIVCASKYSLKYDDKKNKMRDLTWEELKITYGKGKNVCCPCMNREYTINSAFIQHHSSQKHKNWILKEQNEYIQEFGQCGNAESKIDILYKQHREHKVMYHKLSETKEICDKKLDLMENENSILNRQLEHLKRQESIKTIMINEINNNNKTEMAIILMEFKEVERNYNLKSYNSTTKPILEKRRTFPPKRLPANLKLLTN